MTRSHSSRQPDWQLHDAQERVAQQEALVRRSIVKGAPTQAAEDQLRQLEQALLRMKEQRAAHPRFRNQTQNAFAVIRLRPAPIILSKIGGSHSVQYSKGDLGRIVSCVP